VSPSATATASVVGASGYAGGELVRLLADHPEFELVQATSRSETNRTVGHVHPNLRDLDLRFTDPGELDPVDVLFAATPHGVSMTEIDRYRAAAETVVDLSADFRLSDPSAYDRYYDGHDRPELLGEAVYALPELHREELPGAELIAVGGCNATAAILALAPLVEAGLVGEPTVVDLKVGSSEGGAGGGAAGSHPERSGVVRPYAPTGHRHEAELAAELGVEAALTVHAVDMTRGAAATCHAFSEAAASVERGDLWAAYRERYDDEPFVDVVAGGGGLYRYPEPKIVAGTNRAEVGFAVDTDRIVAFGAIDNLLKGAAGQAVQAANVAVGVEETAGLDRRGLHPVGAP